MIEDNKNKYLMYTFYAILLSLILTIQVFAENAKFIIFHTSDIHGHINAHADSTSKLTPKPLIGGFAVLKNCIDKTKSSKEAKDARVLYFDSGDMFQGTPVVNRTKGHVMIDMFNHMGLNAMTIGNHDFDYTDKGLSKELLKASFPIVCCNVFNKDNGKLFTGISLYKIFTSKDKKIAVIGVDTPSTPLMTYKDNVEHTIFKDPKPILRKLIKILKQSGIDFIILLSHLGFDEDLKLAKNVQGINLIFGGHSHVLKTNFVYSGPNHTPIVHSGAYCEHTSKVTIILNDNDKPKLSMQSIKLEMSKFGENPKIKKLEQKYLKDLQKEMNKVIGENEVNLHRGVCGGDSPLGSVIADAMKDASDSDFAFINFGGVRESVYKGKVTVGDIFRVQPFDNKIVVLTMSGKDLLELIEKELSNPFAPMKKEDKEFAMNHFNLQANGLMRIVGPEYGYLFPSNLIIKFNPEKPAMHRIISVTDINHNPIVPNKLYKVAFNDFMVGGGDGFDFLKNYKRHDTNILVRDALINEIAKTNGIKKKPAMRMINTKLDQKYLD